MKTRQISSNAALTALLVFFCGCNLLGDIHHGIARGTWTCFSLADCAATLSAPECRKAVACENRRCIFEDTLDGTPLTMQTAGDCTEIQCDGAGNMMLSLAPADFPDDGNPCTLDACIGSTPIHTIETELPCYSGPAGTKGRGICTAGIQHCDTQGNPIGGCEGEALPEVENCISPLDDDCDGQTNEDGAGCICTPGETVACYTGPAWTLGIGICHAGTTLCDGIGNAGECVGEELPQAEDCDPGGIDEDCDGHVNEEGPSCTCGDGDVSFGEACDDGNTDPTGGCDALCRIPECGDNIVQPGELCDDGNLDWTDSCTGACRPSACGDGYVQDGENCDDGNTADGDDCSAICLRAVVQLDARDRFTCALLDDGRLKCWGVNNFGQLGLGDTNNRGDAPGETGDHLPAVDLGTGKTAVAFAVAYAHACAILNDSSVKCWGRNAFGQLGLGDTDNRGDDPGEMGDNLPPVNLGTGKTAVAIAGGSHTCALLNDGSVKCWGYNASGRLGLGDTDNRGDNPGEMGDKLPAVDLGTGKTAVAIAADAHSCAILNDGSAKCWGHNLFGQLGLGDKADRGGAPGEMGDNLPAVDLGQGSTAIATGTGGHTCVILNDGRLKCWGRNEWGQLGIGDTQMRGDGPGEMGQSLPAVNLGTGKTAVAITAGYSHTCALLNDHSLKCWGVNWDAGRGGVLGQGDTINRGDSLAEMGNNLPAVNLGTGKNAVAVAAGSGFTCALLNDHNVKCWGYNGDGLNGGGQLGLGDFNDRGANPGEMGDMLPFVVP